MHPLHAVRQCGEQLLHIHDDDIWMCRYTLLYTQTIGEYRLGAFPQAAIFIKEGWRDSTQLILEGRPDLQLTLLSNHQQAEKDGLHVKSCFATDLHTSFELLHCLHRTGNLRMKVRWERVAER